MTLLKNNQCGYQRLSLIVTCALFSTMTRAALLPTAGPLKESATNKISSLPAENIYVANNNSIQQLLYVVGGVLHRPFVVSPEAAKKRISGNFNLNKPQALLTQLATTTGLIWYDDGSSIYVYDASEIHSRVIRLAVAPFERLVAYLQSSGLYDTRFPLRSDGDSGSFYVSGPPVYVELITTAAKYMDSRYARPGSGETSIRVIKLKNTFVNDRTYTQRDVPTTLPGVATVLNQLLNASHIQGSSSAFATGATVSVNEGSHYGEGIATTRRNSIALSDPSVATAIKHSNDVSPLTEQTINIVGYPDTNSLLVKGSARQVSFVEDLVSAIDIPKQQIQLSLWIIDISKDDINELGIRWQGAAQLGKSGITINTSSLTPEGSLHFLADISALARKGNAQVISRPEILTQENVPALFDNNSSFYAKLVGERNSSLEKITYGTMISVLPRLAEQQNEIEMILNIQDGGLPLIANGTSATVDSLPVVSNTQISTAARVPINYSLLVGGYSRNHDEHHDIGIPLLRDIPYLGRLFNYRYTSHEKKVRLFLIQPRLLLQGETWQGTIDMNPVLGRSSEHSLRLQSTVAMLRAMMNAQ